MKMRDFLLDEAQALLNESRAEFALIADAAQGDESREDLDRLSRECALILQALGILKVATKLLPEEEARVILASGGGGGGGSCCA
jgi:hypothetical protein